MPEATRLWVALLKRDGEHLVKAVAFTSRGRANTKEVVSCSLALQLVVKVADIESTLNLRFRLLMRIKCWVTLIIVHEHHRIEWIL